jgi:hypothetical protein
MYVYVFGYLGNCVWPHFEMSFLMISPLLKGSVQRKLRWVENGVNRSVGASDCGAGHSFVVLFRFHLGFSLFPFPVSTAEFIGEFWKIKLSATSDVAPIVLALYRIVIGATSISALKGEAGPLRCANRRSAANSQHQ